MEYNIYCDESCHLENDNHKSMVIGAVWCAYQDKEEIFQKIREIKKKHDLNFSFEIKWGKISQSKIDFYLDIVNFFFDTDKLNFRALIIPDKAELDHEKFNQTHDEFYYKTYFDMLKVIISPKDSYNIYLDTKDTQGYEKVKELHRIISNNNYDFSNKIVRNIQEVDSKQVSILQIADLLVGAMSYHFRGLNTNPAKLKIIELIKERSGYNLEKYTLPTERKFNFFIWRSGYARGYGNV